MMINSPPLPSNSNKRIRFSLPRTKNNDDLLISSTSEKFEDINNNHYQEQNNSIDCNNAMKQEILVSDNNNNNNNNIENDTTLLTTTTTTTTTTVEFKVKTTKTSSRKRKSNIINDTNNDITKEQAISKKKKNKRMKKSDDELFNNSNKKSKSKTTDQASSTEESSFGSCEPGTNVVLQGIVWNETDKGVLVVNITWRGKTYVGALMNTTEQNWAPPRYKSDVRSIKQNHNRDHQLPSTYESSERILRNGKRRGSATTVIGNATTKMNSFKMPDVPPTKNDNQIKMNVTEDEINSMSDDKSHMKNLHNPDDEVADSYSSSRSISPTTSGTSTTSSSPLLSNNIENQSASLPMDLSNSKINVNIEQNTSNSMVQPYHFSNDMLFPLSTTSDYFSSLENSANPLGLPSFNKLSPTTSSPSSYHSIPAQIYLNSSSTL
ncbi:unnamed protein product [Rotaria magnacalcarata]|uniref:Uncharacterized protein n=4 Tax=Rotaria magnacalcarata TaxID=392030 RepID=A0A816SUG0_9BILA|nr:unnamed protein product [Rotaria magnacalcarata]